VQDSGVLTFERMPGKYGVWTFQVMKHSKGTLVPLSEKGRYVTAFSLQNISQR
jgi:hypothetical protein